MYYNINLNTNNITHKPGENHSKIHVEPDKTQNSKSNHV